MTCKTGRKEFRLTDQDKYLLREGAAIYAKGSKVDESEYIRFLIKNGRQLLDRRNQLINRENEIRYLVNEINEIGVNIKQITKNNNSELYRPQDKDKLDYYLKKIFEQLKVISDCR